MRIVAGKRGGGIDPGRAGARQCLGGDDGTGHLRRAIDTIRIAGDGMDAVRAFER